MLENMQKTFGNVFQSCKATGISRQTHYNWMASDAVYKTAIEDIKEGLIDIAESHLAKQMNDGNTTALIFFLKTQGKARGYGDAQEIKISGDVAAEISVLTPEQVLQAKKILGA